MVKVLENQLIDLDLLPGLKPADLYSQASKLEQANPEKAEALRKLAAARAEGLAQEVERKTSGVPLRLPGKPEPAEEVRHERGGLAGVVEGVGMGLVGTIGALGKGVGDTLGNTVYALGSGLVGTGSNVAGGLAQTGKAVVPVGEPDAQGKVPVVVVDADSPIEEFHPADAKKSGPRKIELRGSLEKGSKEDVEESERLAKKLTVGGAEERLPSPSPGRFEEESPVDVQGGCGVWADSEGELAGLEDNEKNDASRGRGTNADSGLKVQTQPARSKSPRLLDQPDEPKFLREETDSPNEGKWRGITFKADTPVDDKKTKK